MPGPPNAEVAAHWRTIAISPYEWHPSPDQAGAIQGEAGGFLVDSFEFPRRAYMKPTNAHGDEVSHARAAREKIASDLAYDLGLRVPPALLTIREDPPAGCTPNVVVSLIMCPLQWSWAAVRGIAPEPTPLGAAMAMALTHCSAMLAFDTWLGQTDHGDHPENIIMGYNSDRPNESGLIFLDYANSLGFNGQWNGGAWQPVQTAPWPPRMLGHLDQVALRAAVQRIEELQDEPIRNVVTRIPESHLPTAEKPIIIDGLLGRRGLLRGALQANPGLGAA